MPKLQIRQEETIVAISTPAGEGGIGMVRLSGAGACDIAKKNFRNSKGNAFKSFRPRYANYGYVVDDKGEKIDEALLTVMYSPKTYTREDMVEVTCHGGPMVTKKILQAFIACGARLAEPGEFSKRAFLNGRIDLVQAEAIIDIIRSRSEKGWKTAFSQLDGKLSERLASLESKLVTLLTDIEVGIDFPDEDFIAESSLARVDSMESLIKTIGRFIDTYDTGRIYREGIAVAIAGRPNVGKSSLMNALLERDRVIVTGTPGTTRDTVEETLQIEGIAVKIIDTAGLRETIDATETFGVQRSMTAIEEADLALLVFDGSVKLTAEDNALIETVTKRKNRSDLITVINKSDLTSAISKTALSGLSASVISVSAKKGDGVDDLKKAISDAITDRGETFGEGQVVTRERHVALLRSMEKSVARSLEALHSGMSDEFIAADLSDAKESLGQLTGKSVTEEVIDKIFNEFCIGK